MIALDFISSALLMIGVFFGLTGAIGLFRFPDFFTRVHAASVTDSVSAIFILGGLAIHAGFTLITVKLLFILVFLLLTAPTASHALAKSARHGGLLTLAEKAHSKSGGRD